MIESLKKKLSRINFYIMFII